MKPKILMAAYTNYPRDPRVKREAEALVAEGYKVVFLASRDPFESRRETIAGVEVIKVMRLLKNRTSMLAYMLNYGYYFLALALHLSIHPLRYRLIHINNMPDFLVLAAWLPPGPVTILSVLVLTGWAWNARVLRAQTLSLAQRDFVLAAKVSGESSLRIVCAEILPNMLSLMTSSFIGATIYAIGAQVGLEFLGLGDISKVTWGTNLYWASNDSALLLGSWWTFVPTGFCIALLGFGLTLINFGVDEIANPRLATESRWVRRLKKKATSDGSTPVLEGGVQ